MRYLGPTQIQAMYDKLGTEKKLDVMNSAFHLKDMHPEYSKTDCIALSMGCNLCQSGSGFYEKDEEL